MTETVFRKDVKRVVAKRMETMRRLIDRSADDDFLRGAYNHVHGEMNMLLAELCALPSATLEGKVCCKTLSPEDWRASECICARAAMEGKQMTAQDFQAQQDQDTASAAARDAEAQREAERAKAALEKAADALEAIAHAMEPSVEAYDLVCAAEDQAAWWEAYLAAMQGCIAHYGDAQSNALAASICEAFADAALAAYKARWDATRPTQKEG